MDRLEDIVLRRGVTDAWLNPHVDRQFTFQPARISPYGGSRSILDLGFINYSLPDTGRAYAVFELGQLNPALLGLEEAMYNWIPLEEAAQVNETIINAHINHRMLVTGSAWVTRSPDRNTLFAIDYLDNRELLESKYPLYLRFYNNAFLTTPDGIPLEGVRMMSRYVGVLQDAADVLVEYNANLLKPGNSFLYHNGFLTDGLSMAEIKVGDTIGTIYDSAGNGNIRVPLADLPFFESSLDKLKKYLVQLPADKSAFEFYDDLEVYCCSDVVVSPTLTRSRGGFYSRLDFSNMRQVTPVDVSLDSNRVMQLYVQQQGALNYTSGYLQIYFRKATRPVISPDDGNLTKDLMLVDATMRGKIMTGTQSVIDQWKAATLEASAYMCWASLSGPELNEINVRGVFSYHGLNKIVEMPMRLDSSSYQLPPIVRDGGAVYHYDAAGLLVDWRALTTNEIAAGVYQLPPGVASIRTVPGRRVGSSQDLEVNSSVTSLSVSPYASDRFYRSSGSTVWKLAEEGVDFKTLPDGRVEWGKQHLSSLRLRRDSSLFHNRDLTIADTAMDTPINIFEDGGKPASGFPVGRLEVYINGRFCIEGLDYLVEDTRVRICNRTYLVANNRVHILAHGLYSDQSAAYIDFVKYRLLTYGGPFNLSLYRNKDIYIDGCLASYDEIDFSEIRKGTMANKHREGAPYAIISPLNHIPLYQLRLFATPKKDALSLDDRIAKFLEIYYPEKPISGNVFIPSQHTVVSLTLSRILEDILSGALVINNERLSDLAVDLHLKPYRVYLDKDVCNQTWDFDMLTVAPTFRTGIVGVSLRQYQFMEQVNARYLKGRVPLNKYLNIV